MSNTSPTALDSYHAIVKAQADEIVALHERLSSKTVQYKERLVDLTQKLVHSSAKVRELEEMYAESQQQLQLLQARYDRQSLYHKGLVGEIEGCPHHEVSHIF